MLNNLIKFDEIGSTNDYLKTNYKNLKDKTVVTALFQSKGRGRNDRVFVSNKGENLLFSILLKDEFAFKNFELLSLLFGVSLSKYLESIGVINAIKWPNDVLVGGKKVAGILLEAVSTEKMEALIIGCGLNLNQTNFKDLPNAISLKNITNKTYNLNEVLDGLVNTFYREYDEFRRGNHDFIQYVNDHNYFKNRVVNAIIKGEPKEVKVLNILNNGHLLVEYSNEILELNTGELTFHTN